jgi:hypothetical protein
MCNSTINIFLLLKCGFFWGWIEELLSWTMNWIQEPGWEVQHHPLYRPVLARLTTTCLDHWKTSAEPLIQTTFLSHGSNKSINTGKGHTVLPTWHQKAGVPECYMAQQVQVDFVGKWHECGLQPCICIALVLRMNWVKYIYESNMCVCARARVLMTHTTQKLFKSVEQSEQLNQNFMRLHPIHIICVN